MLKFCKKGGLLLKLKKCLALVLSFIMIFCTFAPTVRAETGCECDETPLIYVRGRTKLLQNKDLPQDDEGGTNTQLPYISEERLTEILKEVVPVYAQGYFQDDFEPFRVLITERFAEIYADYALDKNGNVANNSGIRTQDDWHNKTIVDYHKASGEITTAQQASSEVYKYFFQYDCRLDPLEIADDLYEYIQTVKAVTGHSKIKLLARCLGTTITSAYLAKYGWDDVEDVILYNSIANGTAINNSLFNGELYFDADAVDFFATQALDETLIFSFIKQVITMANKTYGLDMTMDYFNMTATKVAKLVVPDILRVSYGTTPGYWAMVSADRYESARNYVFAGVEEEWAGLIEKIDNYHNTVAINLNEMYKQMELDGVNVYIIAKYGSQLYPIMEDAGYQSDTIVTVQQQAPGTTAAPVGHKLSDEYVNIKTQSGLSKYISPDKAVDSSGNQFRDTTWYVKNMDHNTFPQVVDELIYKIIRYGKEHIGERMTVFSDSQFPQYLVYEGEENQSDCIYPMTNDDTGYTLEQPGFFELLADMCKTFFELIKYLFGLIKDSIAA